jgi:hypothetical protein
MTNLLIGYPDIPLRGTVTASATEDSSYPVANLITGSRGNMFQFNATVTAPWIKSDMGASATASMQYFFIARANLLKAGGATQLTLQSSTNDSVWTDRIGAAASFQTRTFTGPRSEDLLFTSSFNDDEGGYSSSAFRYWRILGATTASKFMFSKWYCGNWFDFGREPAYPAEQTRGALHSNQREPSYIFDLTWVGISNSLKESFIDTIVKYKDISPVVLYDAADYVLNAHKTLHAWVREVDITVDVYNQHTIRARFEEAL